MTQKKPGAISSLDLKEIKSGIAALKAAGQDATELEQAVATAQQIQAACAHRGWAHSDGSLYLECGGCGAEI